MLLLFCCPHFPVQVQAEAHDEVVRILTLHSVNVNSAVMYIYYKLNTLHVRFLVFLVSGLEDFIN